MAETKTAAKPKAKPAAKPKAVASESGSSKSNEILNAIVNHVTRSGSEADDALLASLHDLSGGKVGLPARGTTSEDDDA